MDNLFKHNHKHRFSRFSCPAQSAVWLITGPIHRAYIFGARMVAWFCRVRFKRRVKTGASIPDSFHATPRLVAYAR